MERNVKISLEKAREWYNSGNESLREVALQAFTEKELIEKPWENIKTFEDACRVLIYHGINPMDAGLIRDSYLRNLHKLQIIKIALNGVDWNPNLNTGTIYYPWIKYYPKGSSYDSIWKPVANFKAKEDNKVYTLVGGDYFPCDGLGIFGDGYGIVTADLGLLGCKSEEIAKYFGKTFGKLIFNAIYGQYNNYTWVD
jgi:hypothetical protein